MPRPPARPRIAFQLASKRPRLAPPEDRPLIVHLVVNVEHWEFDQVMPRTIITPPQGKQIAPPDVPNWSWAEYGNRCGMPRLIEAISSRGLPASASMNAACFEVYPGLGEAILEAGWEVIGHGVHQHSVKSEADEAAYLKRALAAFARHTGTRTRGWLGPGLAETFDTPDLLKAEGVDYVCDYLLDDLPLWIDTLHGPLLALPYALDINDSVISAVEKHSSDEMFRRVKDAVAVFEKEARHNPRILAIGLHPHLTGVAHRFGHFERLLDFLAGRPDTIFMTGSQITDWYVEAEKKAKAY